jgi:ABC-type transport system involved in multi-copper enzyme maturation permease subunit
MLSPVATLYIEELKATMRGRFAWLGAAVILLAVGGLATVGTQDTWLDGFGIIAYGLVPLAFIPLAAGAIASPRANRFVESVFTAPVERRDWLIAKILVLLTFAAAYYVALLPMLLVYVSHIGLPFLLGRFLLWTPGILVASVAIGTLIGVLFIGRSVAAPAATGMGVLLAYVGLVPIQELMVARGNGATHTGQLALASPAVLLKNALGFTLVANSIPATVTMTWISLLAVVIGALVLAVWVFLRAQGVETWEATPPQRWTIRLSLIALVLLPVMLADTNYDVPAPPANKAPPGRGGFGRAGANLVLVPRGGNLPGRCCGPVLNRQSAALGTDERSERDLMVLLPVDATLRVANLDVRVTGENGLEATADPNAVSEAAKRLETRAYGNDAPATADGHRIENGWVARIPVTLNPTKPWDIGGNRYPLSVTARYQVGTEPEVRTLAARGAVEAQVASAIYEMGAASAVLPLFCLGAAIRRWRRTR